MPLLKKVIHVQILKVAKGQKHGPAFVQLTHLRRCRNVLTVGEINFAETSVKSFVLSFYLMSQDIHVGTRLFTMIQQNRHNEDD